MLSADHLYRLDYAPVIEAHLQRGASVTAVTTRLPDKGEATRFSNVVADGEGRIQQFVDKPDEPLTDVVACEVFVYDAAQLLATLAELEREGCLGDYGEYLLPRLVEGGDAYTFPLQGYWRDVGTLDAYAGAHRDFLEGEAVALPPARIQPGAELHLSFVCAGAEVAGTVTRSLVGPGAVIEAGAAVRDSVIQGGAVVRAGAVVSRAVVDSGAVIEGGAVIGGQAANARLCVVGTGASAAEGVHLPPGCFIPPHTHLQAGQEESRTEAISRDTQG